MRKILSLYTKKAVIDFHLNESVRRAFNRFANVETASDVPDIFIFGNANVVSTEPLLHPNSRLILLMHNLCCFMISC